MQAVGYMRVSTEEQANSGLGLEAQEAAIRKTAKDLGVSLSNLYVDAGISGAASMDKRIGLSSALDSLSSEDVLIVAKRDRLGRDAFLLIWIEKEVTRRKARIISSAGEGTEDDGPSSILMRRIVDAFSEFERGQIRARTKAALAAKRARGEKTGGDIPYGYQLGKDGTKLTTEPSEQKIIKRIRTYRKKGLSFRKIAEKLNAVGVLTKRRKAWNMEQVRRLTLKFS